MREWEIPLITRVREVGVRTKTLIVGLVAASVMVFSLGVAIPRSGAASRYVSASPSAFCKALESFHATGAPKTTNVTAYRTWLKTYLPYYEQLANEAPNASVKRVMTQLVTLLKYESNTTSAIKLEQYMAANEKQWTNDWKAFATAVLSCVTSMYG